MRIGQLARETGVSADTIRYYEKIGLLPAARRTESGYRDYPGGAGDRLRVIRHAVQLGFPLVEIARVLKVRDSGGAPCRQVRDYAQELVRQIDRRIEELTVEKASMTRLITEWDSKLTRANGARAHLLEDVDAAVRAPRPKHARLRRPR